MPPVGRMSPTHTRTHALFHCNQRMLRYKPNCHIRQCRGVVVVQWESRAIIVLTQALAWDLFS
ncbi:hypothetical protein NSPZN2_100372 [Nitrospira defluvii]|uniref:Uncharacterized protein n=1 Tax=Nitrospira defluvii TaxID=330214 RepID=A0ABM8R3Q2_9BACT|nr:hypothetical protein NSPZN2_100372 [Nitrospira defluvii]